MRTECERVAGSYHDSIADTPNTLRRPRFDGGRELAAVALGGVLGATLRWLLAVPYDLARDDFPWDVLVVNVVGSLAIGVAAARMTRGTAGWAFAVTGVLGGFTTMSGLALAVGDLVRAGRVPAALASVVATLAGGVGAMLLGGVLAERRSRS